MRGKAGLVIGLAAGYVLGTRAGRERYEQIKAQAIKVWELEPVQKQVTKVEDFGKSALLALPRAAWRGAVKVVSAVSNSGTPGQKLDAALRAGEKAAEDVKDSAEISADAAEATVKKAAASAKSTAKKTSARTSAAKKSSGK